MRTNLRVADVPKTGAYTTLVDDQGQTITISDKLIDAMGRDVDEAIRRLEADIDKDEGVSIAEALSQWLDRPGAVYGVRR